MGDPYCNARDVWETAVGHVNIKVINATTIGSRSSVAMILQPQMLCYCHCHYIHHIPFDGDVRLHC